jgi:PilZ domain
MYVVERKSPRFSFIASAQVVETRTEARLQARISDISREGCYLDMLNPLPTGTRLKINVTHQNQQLDAVGRVVHSELNVGMGVQFEEVGQRAVMDAWLADLA